jgi:hypothetical protein
MRRLALLALSATLACGSEAPDITDLTVTGSYILLSLNGHDVPFTESQTSTATTELLAGTFRVDAGGSWSLLTTRKETVSTGAITRYDSPSGLWTREGTTINFTGTNISFSATFALGKNEMTVVRVENGVTNSYLYKK